MNTIAGSRLQQQQQQRGRRRAAQRRRESRRGACHRRRAGQGAPAGLLDQHILLLPDDVPIPVARQELQRAAGGGVRRRRGVRRPRPASGGGGSALHTTSARQAARLGGGEARRGAPHVDGVWLLVHPAASVAVHRRFSGGSAAVQRPLGSRTWTMHAACNSKPPPACPPDPVHLHLGGEGQLVVLDLPKLRAGCGRGARRAEHASA